MKGTLLVGSLVMFCLACKKDDKRQYSYWYVNNDSFSTNDVVVDQGKARTDIEAKNLTNGFGFTFYQNGLPVDGLFQITNSIYQDQYFVGVGIHYNGEYYNVSHDLQEQLVASSVNGKARYKLSGVWFKNYSNPNDTVLISGTFNEP